MTGGDAQLLVASLLGIGLAIWLIVYVGLPSFLGLMCGAVTVGLLAGLDPSEISFAIQKGFGDMLSGVGIVLVLGFTLGAMLADLGRRRRSRRGHTRSHRRATRRGGVCWRPC